MPFNRVSEFEKSFPAVKNLTTKQKAAALEIFNELVGKGTDDKSAIKQAISASKNIKATVVKNFCILSEVMSEDGRAFADLSDEELTTTEFEILRTGKFYDSRYGVFSIGETLLNQIVENFNKKVLGIDIAVDTNHEWSKGAVAWIEKVSARNGKLYATFKDITTEGKKMLKEKIFKYFSVEFAPFETVDSKGKKVSIPNVLKGLALTNRPVIKGMRPTFLSEVSIFLSTNTPRNMEVLKALLASLQAKEVVSLGEKEALKVAFTALSEEEQEEVKTDVEEVEAKPEPEAEGEGEGEGEGAGEGDGGEPAAATAAELSEVQKQLAEKDKQIKELQLAERARVTEARVSSLMLSEDNKVGFVKNEENAKALTEFISTLTNDQHKAFSDLIGNVRSLDQSLFSEAGHNEAGSSNDFKAKLAEADKKAAEMVKEDPNLSLADALAEVYVQMGLDKEE